MAPSCDSLVLNGRLCSRETPESNHDLKGCSTFPLTEIQRAYLIGRKSTIEYGGVSCHGYIELAAQRLDHDRLQSAWRRLIQRHEMLRAVILSDGSQRILSQVPEYEIKTYDLRFHPEELAELELLKIRNRMSHQVLPADAWPMFEICTTVCPGGTERLHLSMDLLIADLQSVSVLSTELVDLYCNPERELPPVDVSFRDHVPQQASVTESQRYKRDFDYWMGRVPTLPLGPDIPVVPGAAVHNLRFKRRDRVLAAEEWQRVKTRARELGISGSCVLLAAYATTLARWTQSRHFLLNVTLSNRPPKDPRWARVVGDFTGVNLLEVSVPSHESFVDLALRLQAQLRRDLKHRCFSGIRVMRELVRARGLAAPVAPVVFSSNVDRSDATLSNPIEKLGKMVYGISQTPQVWLDHQVYEFNNALHFNWDSADGIFPAGLMDSMFQTYCATLEMLAGKPGSWDENLMVDLVPVQRLRRVEFNATDGPEPSGLLHSGFVERARLCPDAPAIISTEKILSYGELAKRASFLGDHLRAAGASPNRLIGVIMEKGWEQIVGILSTLNAGAAYVPLDPLWPEERIARLLRDSAVEIVLTQSRLRSKLDLADGRKVFYVDQLKSPGDYNPSRTSSQRPEDLAYVIYTSGSTGNPKGVAIDHQAAVNTIVDINSRFDVGETDRVFAISALNFDLSVYDIFGTLAAGGAIVLPDHDKLRDPEHWLNLVEKHGVSIWNSVPALMQMFAEEADSWLKSLPGLRLVLLSGDWIPVPLPRLIQKIAPKSETISLGGATEAAIWSIAYPIEHVNPDWTSIPYGRPLRNQRFYVLDGALHDSPDWVTGELYIGGRGLARGYWGDAAKTQEKFIIHPSTGERLYRTGDLGRMLPDGNIEFQGRADFQVKIHGYRIELGEIESALNECPLVRRAVVAAPECSGSKRLVAYVVLDHNKHDSGNIDLRGTLSARLPEYMLPSEFVFLDELPLTANGKLDWGALNGKRSAAIQTEQRTLHPTNPAQEKLAQMWAQVLEIPIGQLDIRTSFFHMGGDSLSLIRLLRMMRQEFGAQVDARDVFVNPTIEQWANLLSDTDRTSTRISLVPLRETGINPSLFWVPAADGNVLIFKTVVELLGPEQPFYGFQFVGDAEDEKSGISIENNARRNLELLRSVQPHGPYHLAGYCWGCTAVLEMARQLRASGERVAQLIIVDPLHPDYYGYFLENPVLLIGLMAQVINPGRDVDLMSIETLQGLSLEEQISRAYKHLQETNLLLPELSENGFRAMLFHFQNNLKSLVEYKAQSYDGSVTLFVVEDYPQEWLAYWRRIAPALRVVELRGTHYSIWVDRLHARAFSDQLRSLMRMPVEEPCTVAVS